MDSSVFYLCIFWRGIPKVSSSHPEWSTHTVTSFFYRLHRVPSHKTVSSLASRSDHKSPENHVIGQWLTMICCLSRISTYARRVWGLVPPNKISCTSTLTSSKSVQCGPRHRDRLKPGGQMVGWVTGDNSSFEPCINPLRCSRYIWCWSI